DLEPNTPNDPITNITLTYNFISQEGSTGVVEPNVYGIVTHGTGGPFGPITITNNQLYGTPYQWSGGWYPTGNLYTAIYLNYGGINTNNHDVENNYIQWSGASIVVAGSNDNQIINNSVIGPNANLIVSGTNNFVLGNYVASV